MKTYVSYQKTDLAGNMATPCGTDNYYQLDGRNTTLTQIADACKRAYNFRNIRKWEQATIYSGNNITDQRIIKARIELIYLPDHVGYHATYIKY